MKSGRYIYAGALVVALVVGLGLWKPTHVKAHHERVPKFRVDPLWPKELPAPVGYNQSTWPTPTPGDNVAHRWVQGEVAASCMDADDTVYTFNRGWQVGATVNGVLQNNESGAIDSNDATPALALPSPPVVAFAPDGRTITARSFGNPSLWATANHGAYTGTNAIGRSAYMPYGSHGCFVDYNRNLWVGGNGDGIVQEYNPAVAGPAGGSATYIAQIGTKDVCDTTTGICGATANNSSHVLLNEPPDIAVDPGVGITGHTGDIYVADGYGNTRVVVFNPALAGAGNPYGYFGQWGNPCPSPGADTWDGTTTPGSPCPLNTFGTVGGGHPHCVVLGNDGNVYLCDRPNSRILVVPKSSTYFLPSTGAGCTSVPAETTPNTTCVQPTSPPAIREIYINNFPGNYPTVTSGKVEAILYAGDRACDMDFYPNIDYLAGQSPTSQKYIVDVDLESDNSYLLDKATGEALTAFGRCGFAPCPGHNPGEFAYGHTTTVDSKGNVYIAETITGRRIQKFVRVDDDH